MTKCKPDDFYWRIEFLSIILTCIVFMIVGFVIKFI